MNNNGSGYVSICFNCLFLGFLSILSFVLFLFEQKSHLLFFPPLLLKTKQNFETLFPVVYVFSKRFVRYIYIYICSVTKKKGSERKSKEDGIPCVLMLSNYLSTLSFCYCCFCFFFSFVS